MANTEQQLVADIEQLNAKAISLTSQIASIRERQIDVENIASEQSNHVAQSLREYAADPTTKTEKAVTIAKTKYNDTQKRTITESESLKLVVSDLSAVEIEAREKTKTLAALRASQYREGWGNELDMLFKEIAPNLARCLALNRMINGMPVGQVDIKPFIHARIPKLKQQAQDEVNEINNDLRMIESNPTEVEVA